MADTQKSERIIFSVTPEMLDRIDAWRHDRRIASRAEAIRLLIEQSLKAAGQAGDGGKG